MRFKLVEALCQGVLAVLVGFSFLGVSETAYARESAVVTLEEPKNFGTASGVGNIRGWVVSDYPVDRVEIWINGEYFDDAPYGGQRPDVKSAFASYPNSLNSGFGQSFNFGDLPSIENTIEVRAYSEDGLYLGASEALFLKRSLPKPFYPKGQEPFLGLASVADGSEFGYYRDDLEILGVIMASGETLDLRLEWSSATQNFEVIEFGIPEDHSWPECDYNFYEDQGTFDLLGFDVSHGSTVKFFVENSSAETIYLEEISMRDEIGTLFTLDKNDLPRRGEVYGYEIFDHSITFSNQVFRKTQGHYVADFLVSLDGQCYRHALRVK